MKKCKRCDNKLSIIKNKLGNIKRTVYCSTACARPIKNKIELKCSNCQKLFKKYPSKVKNNKENVFCGNECVLTYRKNNEKINTKTVNYFFPKKRTHEVKECLFCGKRFRVFQCKLKRTTVKYCSKTCLYSKSPKERFWDAVEKGKKENDCWGWHLKKDKNGYSIFWIEKSIKAHRYSYEIHHGKIPDGLIVCHKCDNPTCTNPLHLYAGTHKDNALDKIDKNRWKQVNS
jgi:hypothetical protein